MSIESKGRGAWYDRFYLKLETILVESDTLASQGKVSLESSDSVKDEPEKLTENHFSDTSDTDLPRCKSPSGIPSDSKFEISRSVLLGEGDRLKENLSEFKLTDDKMFSSSLLLGEHNDCDQRVATSQGSQGSPENFINAIECNDDTFVSTSGILTGDLNLISLPTEIQVAPVEEKVANIRAFTNNCVTVNQDDFLIEDFDAPLDTIDLYDMTIREDPSDFDDNLLYAARDRTRQLRSFKRKVMDALTSKRRREKEYEQLAIWFGDADMGCDLIKTKEQHATTSLDSKSSQSNVPFASEDSEWELL